MKMEFVYMLWHIHEDERLDHGEDVKLIGVHTTKIYDDGEMDV